MKKLVSMLAAGLMLVSLAMPAFAEEGTGFVGSIEQKPAPGIETGTTVTIDGSEVPFEELSSQDVRLVITPVSQKDSAPNSEITGYLTSAYNDISVSGTSEIVFTSEDDQAKFDEVKKDAESRGKTIVASNVVDLSVIDNNNKIVSVDAISATLSVDNASDLVLVMHKADDTWTVVPFVINDDGTITVSLTGRGVLAFFVETGASSVTPGDDTSSAGTSSTDNKTNSSDGKVTSPNTGVESNGIMLVAAVIALTASGACIVKSKKS